jgi:beta-fructofuranosidase
MGDWWYLIYSTFSERHVTHYRMSRSLRGPWQAPENDTFDGRAYYAAKSAADGERRFLFGWVATREGEKDDGPWQWGGNLVVHEIHQEVDGTLSVSAPDSVSQVFPRPASCQFQSGLGHCEIHGDCVRIAAPEGYGCAVGGAMPERCKIEATVALEPGTRGGGIMLRCSDDLEAAYYLRLEPGRNRLVFDSWPRPGDKPFAVELERPLDLSPGKPVALKVFVDGDVCVAYAAGKIAISTRLYNRPAGQWGIFVNEGAGRFNDLRLLVP